MDQRTKFNSLRVVDEVEKLSLEPPSIILQNKVGICGSSFEEHKGKYLDAIKTERNDPI